MRRAIGPRSVPVSWILADLLFASALVAATTFLPTASIAAVRYTEVLRSPGPGNAGMTETRRLVTISGLMQRFESSTHEEGVVGEAAGIHDEPAIQIVRLDRGRMWTIDPAQKTYKERRLADLKQELADAAEKLRDDSVVEAPDAAVKIDLRSTGQRHKVGSWDTERVTLTVSTQGIDHTTGRALDAQINCDLWVTKGLPEETEIRDFEQNYMDSVGRSSELMLLPGLTAEYPKAFAMALEATKGIPGVPVAWRWSIERQPTADEEGSMAEDRNTLEDLSASEVKGEDDPDADKELDPMHDVETGGLTKPDKTRERPAEDLGGSELPAFPGTDDDVLPTKEGMITVLRLSGKLENIQAVSADSLAFEIPPGLRADQP